MKPRGYVIHFGNGRLSVEHRASVRPRTIAVLGAAYLCYCALPHVRHALADTYSRRDPVMACFALFFLLIPPLCFCTWLFFTSGELMLCDVRELRIAKRRTWGRWRRFQCPSADVQQLKSAWRGGPRQRSYNVLTFQYKGRTFDILEELSRSEMDRVLKACKELGLDIVLPSAGQGAAMLNDIERRSWFVNPLKPDHNEPPLTP